MLNRFATVDERIFQLEKSTGKPQGVSVLKSNAGRRRAPLIPMLRAFMTSHLKRVHRTGRELIFGRSATELFTANGIQARADEAWTESNVSAAGEGGQRLERITPHSCRRTFASLIIAPGLNAKALSTFMFWATPNIPITLGRYGHLMPGSEAEAALHLQTYLERNRDARKEAIPDLPADTEGASAVDSAYVLAHH